MITKELKEKIEILKKETFAMFPENKTELNYKNDFQLLISIIMSAQTTDKQVNKVNEQFFKQLINPLDGVNLGEEKIRNYIKSISFYRNKAKYIYQTCNILTKIYNSKIPDNLEELITLPGVGIKTAKVFLAVSKNAPYLGVDTHVHRVLNRVGIVKTKSPLETNNKVEKLFTENDNAKLHHSLVFFGRYHCIARKPKCLNCPLIKICKYMEPNFKESLKK